MLIKDVRFKNQGLDSIEVQDNGAGISPDNYNSLALKHYTSKLSTYADLTTLRTFGFRGEALSSLCALSHFTVTTCLESDVPKGTKLEFETSGKLKGTSVVATQKGTTVSIENLFQNLPVRRRELERNIKREWGKVISLLNQYACVQTGVKFTVSQLPNKGKRIVLFSTKGNKATRDNIINVFGAKTMSALVALDLKLELEPTSGPGQLWNRQEDGATNDILIKGFVSKPVHGEGRQTPDRQMFYVNSRPCGLPQFAKVFNEVYRSFNSSQSPFIFADIQLDTHLYDVNVSPDKRTILLHEQSRMLNNLRESLTELFEKQDFTVPMSQITPFKQPPFKKLTVTQEETLPDSPAGTNAPDTASTSTHENEESIEISEGDADTPGISRIKKLAAAKTLARKAQTSDLMTRWVERKSDPREEPSPAAKQVASPTIEKIAFEKTDQSTTEDIDRTTTKDKGETTAAHSAEDSAVRSVAPDNLDDGVEETVSDVSDDQGEDGFRARLAQMKRSLLPESLRDDMSDSEMPDEAPIPAVPRAVKPPDNAPLSVSTARLPNRTSQEVATITIGEHTVTSIIGTPSIRARRDENATAEQSHSQTPSKKAAPAAPMPSFGGRLTQMFAAAVATQKVDGDEPLRAEAVDSDSEARHSEKSDSESIPESSKEPDGASDMSSPMFVEQDEQDEQDDHEEDQQSSASLQEEEEILGGMDGEYVDDDDNNAREDPTVQAIITAAEEAGHEPSAENMKRTQAFLKGGGKGKYSTQALLQRLNIDEGSLQQRLESCETQLEDFALARESSAADDMEAGIEAEDAEDKLSLTIHKGDFGKMKIVGQFNLGFVLAVRPSNRLTKSSSSPPTTTQQQPGAPYREDDELFIVDQHASDEKFNFERLQATTVVQSQRLVRPKPLELTAVEEEIVIENRAALEKNGFVVDVDESGDEPVGARCQLLSLPLSRETTFSLADLEELISLLGDCPTITTTNDSNDDAGEAGEGTGSTAVTSTTTTSYVPRPSKVRKMFAMRACRSSIMIGKALSRQQMERVVRHMGEMEKPWNCPHGRPTMRHLCGLGGAWDERGWREGDVGEGGGGRNTDWAGYVRQKKTED